MATGNRPGIVLAEPLDASDLHPVPRTFERAATELLSGVCSAERAAMHLALAGEIFATLGLSTQSGERRFEELGRDLARFAEVLRVRASSLRDALPAEGR